jgi:Resolvase, N terminal domain
MMRESPGGCSNTPGARPTGRIRNCGQLESRPIRMRNQHKRNSVPSQEHGYCLSLASGNRRRDHGYSLDDQRRELRRWLGENCYRKVEEIEDGAWSGGDLQRPGLDGVRERIRGGAADADQEQMAAVRRIFDLVGNGASIRSVLRTLERPSSRRRSLRSRF